MLDGKMNLSGQRLVKSPVVVCGSCGRCHRKRGDIKPRRMSFSGGGGGGGGGKLQTLAIPCNVIAPYFFP